MNRKTERVKNEERKRQKQSEHRQKAGGRKTRVDIAQCSLITRAAEVQEPDMSNPVDTRGRAMGSGSTEGGETQHRAHRRLMCFPAIYKPIKKGTVRRQA